ncbi:MAG: sel1 repeat family protein, partial [Muribaculaceae bacterium]|nr:sel1 repeat family protein [Muribaculaceae bacterium]
MINILRAIMLVLFLSILVDVQAEIKKTDYTKLTIAQLKTKANNNDAEAQFQLGMKYKRGNGVEKSEQTAISWLKMAAENNHGEACGVLGDIYCDSGNMEQGVYYLRKGASLGDGRSYYNLFLAYSYGRYGVPQNENIAGDFLVKSAEARFGSFTVVALAYMYGTDGLSKDKKKAIYWLKKACDKSYAEYLESGKMPREGDGWPYFINDLKELGCDYDPSLHVDEFKRWMNEKPEARFSSNPSNTANNAVTPKSSKVETYVYTKSGRGQSQNTGQWTDAIGSEECVVQFTDDGISVNGMYQPYVKTSGIWKVYGGTSMGFGGTNTTFYYYVDGNKTMKHVCESYFPYSG